jgi:molecular chaperone IbpA
MGLGIMSIANQNASDSHESHEFVHQGIATRTFKRSWTIADDVEIKDADLVDGMLTIHLEQIIPDYKKPREIPIGGKARKAIKG